MYILLDYSKLFLTVFKLSEQNLHQKEILEISSERHCANFILNTFFQLFSMTYNSILKIIDSMLQFNVEGNTNFTALLNTTLKVL